MHELAAPKLWYSRKNGWIQGPFTEEQIRQLYVQSYLHKTDQISCTPSGPWSRINATPAVLTPEKAPPVDPRPTGPKWECPSATAGSVDFGTLQLLAATGLLRSTDNIRLLPDGNWQHAQSVRGLFGGKREWCTACGSYIHAEDPCCPNCKATQPPYEHTLAAASLACGVVATIWQLITFVAIALLVQARGNILTLPAEEKFPQIFTLTTFPTLWLAIVSIILGVNARKAIRCGRAAPEELSLCNLGLAFGVTSLAVAGMTSIAAVAYGLSHFRLTP